MAQKQYLTPEGYEKLKQELEHLKTVERPKIAQAIAEARDKGDLSENAEYDAAKDAQGMLEKRINDLTKILANARILNADELDTSEVRILTRVKVLNKKTGKEVVYQLVSASEADLKNKKISVSSPVGEGLLGKKVGETAIIKTPAGQVEFEILEISI